MHCSVGVLPCCFGARPAIGAPKKKPHGLRSVLAIEVEMEGHQTNLDASGYGWHQKAAQSAHEETCKLKPLRWHPQGCSLHLVEVHSSIFLFCLTLEVIDYFHYLGHFNLGHHYFLGQFVLNVFE